MSNVSKWSATDDNNNFATPDGWPEGQLASTTNDCGRANMGGAARWFKDTNGSLSAGGSTNTYTLTTNAVLQSASDHSLIVTKIPVKNTGTSTFALDSLSAREIMAGNVSVPENYLAANRLGLFAYNQSTNKLDLVSGPASPVGEYITSRTNVSSGKVIIPKKYTTATIYFSLTPNSGLPFARLGTADSIKTDSNYSYVASGGMGEATANASTSAAAIFCISNLVSSVSLGAVTGVISLHGMNDAKQRPSISAITGAKTRDGGPYRYRVTNGQYNNQLSANAIQITGLNQISYSVYGAAR